MPRPKRSKVVPSAPITLPHLAKSAVASAAQKQKELFSPESSGRVTTTSDDSDGLVVSEKTAARGKGLKAPVYTMSGALAPEDIGSTRLKPPSNQTRAALSKIAREADYAGRVAEENSRRETAQADTVTEPDHIPSSIPTEPVLAPKPSLSVTVNSSAFTGTQMGMGSRIGATPRQQPSMLGATFKKRARQPSLLQMLQTQNDPSDNLEDDDLDDFRPDDESTPMIKSMLQSGAHQHTSSSSSGSRKRKLATPEIQVPVSQTFDDPPSTPPSIPPQEQQDLYDLPAEAEEEETLPEPTLPPPRSTRTQQPQIDSDTLAPPQSSSPDKPNSHKHHSKPTKPAPRSQKPTRRQQPPAPSPLSSTSTNPSPVKPIPMKPLTTATLQNLLPRRRARPKPRTEYDIPNSSSDVELDNTALGEDEDELSFHAAAKMRRKKKPGAAAVPQKRGGRGREGAGKRVSRTYTKKAAVIESEEEGEEGEDGQESGDGDRVVGGRGGGRKAPALDGKAKDEMKRLADKFREVDDYALDFEDMTGNSSSQMRDAR